MRMENVRSHEASNAHKTSHSAFLNSKKRPAEQPIVKALINMENHNTDLMNKLTCHCFYHFITNIVNCKTTVQFCYR